MQITRGNFFFFQCASQYRKVLLAKTPDELVALVRMVHQTKTIEYYSQERIRPHQV